MSELDYKEFLWDLLHMIKFLCVKSEMSDSQILYNVAHDLEGVVYDEPCFLPRCTGYFNAWIKKEKENFNDRNTG